MYVQVPVGMADMQPSAISAMVPKPNSSALRQGERRLLGGRVTHPMAAAMTTSQPLFRPPSTRSSTRSRSPLFSKVEWLSTSPSSQGDPHA